MKDLNVFAQPNDSNFVFKQHTSEWMEKQKCEVCVLAKQNKTKICIWFLALRQKVSWQLELQILMK